MNRRNFRLDHMSSNRWQCRDEDKTESQLTSFRGLAHAMSAVGELVEGAFAEDDTKKATTVRIRVDLEDL